MKYLILVFGLMGCLDDRLYNVNCEKPFYVGQATWAYSSEDGTSVRTKEGIGYIYPPSVKCELVRLR